MKRTGLDLPEETLKPFANVLSQIFLLHLYGDETMDDNLISAMKRLSETTEAPFDMEDMELDFPPADNNVKINF